MTLRTCVAPSGHFIVGVHKPKFKVQNIRENEYINSLGEDENGKKIENTANFPAGNIIEPNADWIYEIAKPFPFRGSTFISKKIADTWAEETQFEISMPARPDMSLIKTISEWFPGYERSTEKKEQIFRSMPDPIKIAVAGNSTDPEDLIPLAEISAEFIHDPNSNRPTGLVYEKADMDSRKPKIHHYPEDFAIACRAKLEDVLKVLKHD